MSTAAPTVRIRAIHPIKVSPGDIRTDESEPFEVDARDAEQLISAGIAAAAPLPVTAKVPPPAAKK